MKQRLLHLALLLSVPSFAQHQKDSRAHAVPPAVGKQERTQFFDAKHVLCATLAEREAGYWYVYLANGDVSQAFHTHAGHPQEGRAEAYAYAIHFCPVTQ